MSLFDKHRAVFELAQQACATRHCWSPYPDMPDKYPDAAQAKAAGLAAFERHLNNGRFALDQPGIYQWVGEEVSPYTQAPLGVLYPQSDIDSLFGAAEKAMDSWAQASIGQRIGVLMEVLEVIYRDHLFEVLHAVMHTAGQSYNMAYAGSGVNALDRSIEALVYAEQAMRSVAPSALWQRRFGSSDIQLQKTYRLVPRGTAVCFSCASFPTWNAWPSMMASLATGNPVILKPHPATVLPMAITVKAFRQVLQSAGFDPNLVTLALDTASEPIGKRLVQHPKTAIVDFTGSVRFGQWVEKNAHPAGRLLLHDMRQRAPGPARACRQRWCVVCWPGEARGLRDTVTHCGADFWRLRLGIGHPGDRSQVIDYVLQRASRADEDAIVGSIGTSLDALSVFVRDGAEKAMNALHTQGKRTADSG